MGVEPARGVRLSLVSDQDRSGERPAAGDPLTVADAGAALGVSRATAYRMIADGRLAAHRHGRRGLTVAPDEIDRYWVRLREVAEAERIARAKQASRAPDDH